MFSLKKYFLPIYSADIKQNFLLLAKIDKISFLMMLASLTIGVMFIYGAGRNFDAPASGRWMAQVAWILLGSILYFACLLADYRALANYSWLLFLFGLFLLLMVFISGGKDIGARSVLKLPMANIQVSEFVKPAALIFMSWLLSHPLLHFSRIPLLLVWLGFIAVPCGMIVLQGDVGTALTFVPFSFAILFINGLKWRWILGFFLLIAIVLPIAFSHMKPYQKTRIMVFARQPSQIILKPFSYVDKNGKTKFKYEDWFNKINQSLNITAYAAESLFPSLENCNFHSRIDNFCHKSLNILDILSGNTIPSSQPQKTPDTDKNQGLTSEEEIAAISQYFESNNKTNNDITDNLGSIPATLDINPSNNTVKTEIKTDKVEKNYKEKITWDDWNAKQALYSVGSGRHSGRGYLKGTQHTLGFLPRNVAPTDFIFAVISEETGFLGSFGTIAILIMLIIFTCKTAFNANDLLGASIALGAAVLYTTHAVINIGMCIGLAPIIGIPLPFLSYGGSSIVGMMCIAGLAQSVHVHTIHRTTPYKTQDGNDTEENAQ